MRALLACTTVTEAAKVAGVSRQTVYEYLRKPGFREGLEAERQAALDAVRADLTAANADAIEALRRTVNDYGLFGPTPAERIEAARLLLVVSSWEH